MKKIFCDTCHAPLLNETNSMTLILKDFDAYDENADIYKPNLCYQCANTLEESIKQTIEILEKTHHTKHLKQC